MIAIAAFCCPVDSSGGFRSLFRLYVIYHTNDLFWPFYELDHIWSHDRRTIQEKVTLCITLLVSLTLFQMLMFEIMVSKVVCVFLMVISNDWLIWSEFRIKQYRDNDYREHAPHFNEYSKLHFVRCWDLKMFWYAVSCCEMPKLTSASKVLKFLCWVQF